MKFKKATYIVLAMILGVILSFLAHAIIEIFYINNSLNKGILPKSSSLSPKCYLPSELQIFLLLAGLFGGYYLGQKWYKK